LGFILSIIIKGEGQQVLMEFTDMYMTSLFVLKWQILCMVLV